MIELRRHGASTATPDRNKEAAGRVPARGRRLARVVFCPNQVTVAIARGLVARDGASVDTTVIWWPGRCDVSSLVSAGVRCLPYSRGACLGYLLTQRWHRRVEACLPHRKLGRVVNWFARLCTSTSLVDDGLDALRESPRNVEPELFAAGTAFYTCNYEFPLGRWLEKFSVCPVIDLDALADVERKKADLGGISRLIIESPPLGRVAAELDIERKGTALVAHSNINKQAIKGKAFRSINGAEIALERTLDDFSGEMIVGESMVVVYALLRPRPAYRVVVYLARENLENLTPLVRLVESRDFAELKLC